MVDVALKGLQCPSTNSLKPMFGATWIIFSGHYLQPSPVRRFRKSEENERYKVQYINVLLLDQLPWASNLLERMKALRYSSQSDKGCVRRSEAGLTKWLLPHTDHALLYISNQLGSRMSRTEVFGSGLRP